MLKKLIAIILLLPILAFAWEPTHSVVAVVGNAPGAGNEIAFRELTAIISNTQPKLNFIVENRPGADSVVSMNYFVTQPNDGYHISLPSHMSTYVTNDIWEKSVKKFEYNQFTDVLTIGKSPLVLVANITSQVNTPVDFIKLISTTDKPINVAVGGGAHRTALEYLLVKGHGKKELVKAIKFQGPLQAVTSVASFNGSGTEFGIMPIAVAKPLIDSKKVKAIGFTGTHVMPQYPAVPLLNTVAPGINVYAAWAISLPPNTPQPIVDWYTKTFAAAIHTKEYQTWCYDNVVFTEDSELTPAGLHKQMDSLRTTFLPILQTIDLTKE